LVSFPQGIALGTVYDGTNIWVANERDNTLTKLRASDGANLGTFATGITPHWLAFDGAHVWVTNNGGNTVSRL
jgi:DNA-binding beta-propeller fold protein YncE